jgi:hypothetical protein
VVHITAVRQGASERGRISRDRRGPSGVEVVVGTASDAGAIQGNALGIPCAISDLVDQGLANVGEERSSRISSLLGPAKGIDDHICDGET